MEENMIELLDVDLKNRQEYQRINEELIEICRQSHSIKEAEEGLAVSQYMLDYPWIFKQIPRWLVPREDSQAYSIDLSMNKDLSTKILDAGCGKGVFQIFLAKCYELYTVDRRGSLIKAWSKEKEKQFDVKLNFSCQNLKYTNFENDFFDHIVSCSSLEHNTIEDAKIIFRELDRILKPGGSIVFTLEAYKEFKTWYGSPADPIITCYTPNKIKELLENTSLKLLNDKDNFDQFDALFSKFCKAYPMYGLHCMPVGVVVQKQ
jgi:2-polyprenyl-3-methyl-5-hydroxy-6-metoxy-1,4-benzoquinol methylase